MKALVFIAAVILAVGGCQNGADRTARSGSTLRLGNFLISVPKDCNLIWTSKSRFTVSPKEGKKWRLITELLGKPDGRDRLAAAKNYLNVEDRLTKEEGGSSIRASHIEGGKIVRADAYYKVTRGGKTFILHVMALFGNRVLENAVVSAPSAETADAEHILDAIREQ